MTIGLDVLGSIAGITLAGLTIIYFYKQGNTLSFEDALNERNERNERRRESGGSRKTRKSKKNK